MGLAFPLPRVGTARRRSPTPRRVLRGSRIAWRKCSLWALMESTWTLRTALHRVHQTYTCFGRLRDSRTTAVLVSRRSSAAMPTKRQVTGLTLAMAELQAAARAVNPLAQITFDAPVRPDYEVQKQAPALRRAALPPTRHHNESPPLFAGPLLQLHRPRPVSGFLRAHGTVQ